MFLPLKDMNPTVRRPIATYSLIVANVVIFIYELSLGPQVNAFIAAYGATPFEITRMTDLAGRLGAGAPIVHQPGPPHVWLTLLTSMFMHAGLWHLGGNMLYLWIFGNNIEDILGPVKFYIFYLVCGLLAHALHIASDPGSTIPTVGASGAVSGLLGAYLIAYPRARVLTLVFLGFFVRMAVVPAALIIVLWFVMQFIFGLASLGGTAEGGVAWFAHIGGFLGGIALIYAMAGRTIWYLRHGGDRSEDF